MIYQGDGYCTKELDDRPHHDLYKIFFGLMDTKEGREAIPYEIESVRVPKERIAMYARKKTAGTDDIALIRTKKSVIFIPGKTMPVGFRSTTANCFFNTQLEILKYSSF